MEASTSQSAVDCVLGSAGKAVTRITAQTDHAVSQVYQDAGCGAWQERAGEGRRGTAQVRECPLSPPRAQQPQREEQTGQSGPYSQGDNLGASLLLVMGKRKEHVGFCPRSRAHTHTQVVVIVGSRHLPLHLYSKGHVKYAKLFFLFRNMAILGDRTLSYYFLPQSSETVVFCC